MASAERRTLFDKKSGAFTARLSPEKARLQPGYREIAFPVPDRVEPIIPVPVEPFISQSPQPSTPVVEKRPEMFNQGKTPIKPVEDPYDTVGMREKAEEIEKASGLESDIDKLFASLNIPLTIKQTMQNSGLSDLQLAIKAKSFAQLREEHKKRVLDQIPQGKTGS